MFIRYLLLLCCLCGGSYFSAAQTRLDPAFHTPTAYAPAAVAQALQLRDGSRVLVPNGQLNKIAGQMQVGALPLYRILPTGQPDAAFNAQVASYPYFSPLWVAEYPGNKLMVELAGSLTVNGVTYTGLLRLNGDGTLDSSFAPFPYYLFAVGKGIWKVLPDGSMLVPNLTAPTGGSQQPLVRLLSDGTIDAAFSTQVNAVLNSSTTITRLSIYAPTGQILIAGTLNPNTTGPQRQVLRLLPTGALDPSFNLPASVAYNKPAVALTQPDGKVLLGSSMYSQPLLTRYLPDGSPDYTFFTPNNLSFTANSSTTGLPYLSSLYNPENVQVQPDGRILVCDAFDVSAPLPGVNRPLTTFMVRLLSDGTLDPSWQPPAYGDYGAAVYSYQQLPNGQLLVAGTPKLYASATAEPRGLALLDATGSYLGPAGPALLTQASIRSMAVQPDGKIIAGGRFTEIDGVAVRNLVRFNADGTLDPSFGAAATSGTEEVTQVLVQPDGKILVSGGFAAVNGLPRVAVARLLPTGQPDPGFVPALLPNDVHYVAEAQYMTLQADGQVLLSGYALRNSVANHRLLLRLQTTGALDASFAPPLHYTGMNLIAAPLLALPNGRVLVGNVYYGATAPPSTVAAIVQLLPDGSLDPQFTAPPSSMTGIVFITGFKQYPDGRLLVLHSRLAGIGGGAASPGLARLSATGVLDPTFTLPFTEGSAYAALIQPNGRILATGYFTQAGTTTPLSRVLDTGALDTSFDPSAAPRYGARSLAMQPDGGLLLGGFLLHPVTQQPIVLARLLDPNVLSVGRQQSEPLTTAWPVPTHGALHLLLDAAAGPRRVQLLDALGRVVLTKAVAQPELTLPTASLPTGGYVLRVEYASGPITRRVVVE